MADHRVTSAIPEIDAQAPTAPELISGSTNTNGRSPQSEPQIAATWVAKRDPLKQRRDPDRYNLAGARRL
jgi:hypothetical protein